MMEESFDPWRDSVDIIAYYIVEVMSNVDLLFLKEKSLAREGSLYFDARSAARLVLMLANVTHVTPFDASSC
jgi:hypothetical protein